MSVALASQLREGTKKAHTMAENTGFVSCFLKGVVDRETYRKLVADLYFVYSEMEDQVTRLFNEGHPVISRIGYPELNRREKLKEDLLFYFGIDWSDQILPTPSAQAYVNRIKRIAVDSPELLVAHHYTRYIGDLSGGQILRRIAQKAMNLADCEGLNFYEFDLIKDEKLFKLKYSETLNSLPIDQNTADLIVEEANKAFECNMEMFKELEGNLISAIGKVLFRLITSRKRKGSTDIK